jgi:hypothetical protein
LGEVIFVGTLGFILGTIVGAIGLGYFALRSVAKLRNAAATGIQRGLDDTRRAARQKRKDEEDMQRTPSVTKITTYRCLNESCGKTFTTVGPLLTEAKCLHCGAAAEPATKKSRVAAQKMREADSFETNPFGEEVKN